MIMAKCFVHFFILKWLDNRRIELRIWHELKFRRFIGKFFVVPKQPSWSVNKKWFDFTHSFLDFYNFCTLINKNCNAKPIYFTPNLPATDCNRPNIIITAIFEVTTWNRITKEQFIFFRLSENSILRKKIQTTQLRFLKCPLVWLFVFFFVDKIKYVSALLGILSKL